MELKILWGFEGDPEKLKTPTGRIAAGSVIDVEDEELAHALIGKGLAVELDANGKPRVAKPKETKPAIPKEDKAGADKAAAEKEAADKAAAEKAAADKAAADKAATEAK